jgi:hypothetical protein
VYNGNRLCFWTDEFGADLPKVIHHIHSEVQREDLFLCSAHREFAPGVGKVHGAVAHLDEVCEEDIPPFAKISVPHFDTGPCPLKKSMPHTAAAASSKKGE